MSMFHVTLYASVFSSSSRSVSISLLDYFILPILAFAVISSSASASTSTTGILGFVASIGAPVKLPYNSSIIIFSSKNPL